MVTPPLEGWHTLTPRIIVADVSGLVTFIRDVFDARGELETEQPTFLQIGDSLLMVSDGDGQRDAVPAFLYVHVADCDSVFARAVAAGATCIEEPEDQPYGDRRAMVRDAWGNLWQIATRMGE
jgi:uncharacterized glyoxalase superfamily protein PhnB